VKSIEEKYYSIYQKGNIIITSVLIVGVIIIAAWLIYTNASCAKIAETGVFIAFLNSIPVVLLYVGWKKIMKAYQDVIKLRGSCTQPVEAVLDEFEKKTVNKYNDYVTYYYAVYEYTWQGKKYRVKSQHSFTGLSDAGVKCHILIDPADPTLLYEMNDEKSRIVEKRVIGIVMMVIGFILTAAVFKLAFNI